MRTISARYKLNYFVVTLYMAFAAQHDFGRSFARKRGYLFRYMTWRANDNSSALSFSSFPSFFSSFRLAPHVVGTISRRDELNYLLVTVYRSCYAKDEYIASFRRKRAYLFRYIVRKRKLFGSLL